MAALPPGRHEFEADSIGFARALSKLPEKALEALRAAGIGDCRFWAHIVEGEEKPEEVIIDTVVGLCGPLSLEFEDGGKLLWETLVPELMNLVAAAKAPAFPGPYGHLPPPPPAPPVPPLGRPGGRSRSGPRPVDPAKQGQMCRRFQRGICHAGAQCAYRHF